MESRDTLAATAVTPQYLVTLDKIQLVDLLQSRTEHLLVANRAKIRDKSFMEGLMKEIEMLQEEIKKRVK